MKYTDTIIECNQCKKRGHFMVFIVQKRKKYYQLTQCPKCKQHDDIHKLTPEEIDIYKRYISGNNEAHL